MGYVYKFNLNSNASLYKRIFFIKDCFETKRCPHDCAKVANHTFHLIKETPHISRNNIDLGKEL